MDDADELQLDDPTIQRLVTKLRRGSGSLSDVESDQIAAMLEVVSRLKELASDEGATDEDVARLFEEYGLPLGRDPSAD
jgi:hypothetical protein